MFEGTCERLSSVVFMCKLKKQKTKEKKDVKATYKKYQKNQKKSTKVPLRVSFYFDFKKEIKLSLIVADGNLSFWILYFHLFFMPFIQTTAKFKENLKT